MLETDSHLSTDTINSLFPWRLVMFPYRGRSASTNELSEMFLEALAVGSSQLTSSKQQSNMAWALRYQPRLLSKVRDSVSSSKDG